MAHTIDTLEDIYITLEDDKSEVDQSYNVAINQSATNIPDNVVVNDALNMLEAEHLAAIEKNPFSIMFIKNPSEAVQLKAIKLNYRCLRWIKNPSESVQLKAVKLNYHCLHLIKNPSKAVRWAAGYW